MLAQFGIHLTKKDQIHRTGAEKSSKICAQLHRPNTRLCHKYDKIFKMENLEDHRKSARLSMLFKIQRDLIDIDRQQYLTPNDSRTRGKNRFYGTKKDQTRIPTDNHSSN